MMYICTQVRGRLFVEWRHAVAASRRVHLWPHTPESIRGSGLTCALCVVAHSAIVPREPNTFAFTLERDRTAVICALPHSRSPETSGGISEFMPSAL